MSTGQKKIRSFVSFDHDDHVVVVVVEAVVVVDDDDDDVVAVVVSSRFCKFSNNKASPVFLKAVPVILNQNRVKLFPLKKASVTSKAKIHQNRCPEIRSLRCVTVKSPPPLKVL